MACHGNGCCNACRQTLIEGSCDGETISKIMNTIAEEHHPTCCLDRYEKIAVLI